MALLFHAVSLREHSFRVVHLENGFKHSGQQNSFDMKILVIVNREVRDDRKIDRAPEFTLHPHPQFIEARIVAQVRWNVLAAVIMEKITMVERTIVFNQCELRKGLPAMAAN